MKKGRVMLWVLFMISASSSLEALSLPVATPSRLDLPVTAKWQWLPMLMRSSEKMAWFPMTAFNGTQVTGALRLLRRRNESWSDSKNFVPSAETPRLLVPQFRGNAPVTGALKDWKNSDVAAFASLALWDVSSLKVRFMAQPLAGMPVGSVQWERGDQSFYFVVSHLGLLSCITADGRELWRFVTPGTLGAKRSSSQLASSDIADRSALPGGPLVLFRWTSQRSTLLLCLASELRAAWCLDITNVEQPVFRWYREDLPEHAKPLLWGQAFWSKEKLPGTFPLAPLVVGQKIYVASQAETGALVEINPLNGDSHVCCEVTDPLATPPVALLNKDQKIQAFFFCDVRGRFYRCQLSNNRWSVELLQDLFTVATFDGVIESQLIVQHLIDGAMNFIVTARNNQRTVLWNINSATLSDSRWSRGEVTVGNWWKVVEAEAVGRPLLWNRQLLLTLRKGARVTVEALSLESNNPAVHLKSSGAPLLALKVKGETVLVTQDGENSVVKVERLKLPVQPGRIIRRYWRRLGRSE